MRGHQRVAERRVRALSAAEAGQRELAGVAHLVAPSALASAALLVEALQGGAGLHEFVDLGGRWPSVPRMPAMRSTTSRLTWRGAERSSRAAATATRPTE